MVSFDLQNWTRIKAMNLRNASGTPEERAADVSSAEPGVFCRQDAGSTLRFMESLDRASRGSSKEIGFAALLACPVSLDMLVAT